MPDNLFDESSVEIEIHKHKIEHMTEMLVHQFIRGVIQHAINDPEAPQQLRESARATLANEDLVEHMTRLATVCDSTPSDEDNDRYCALCRRATTVINEAINGLYNLESEYKQIYDKYERKK